MVKPKEVLPEGWALEGDSDSLVYSIQSTAPHFNEVIIGRVIKRAVLITKLAGDSTTIKSRILTEAINFESSPYLAGRYIGIKFREGGDIKLLREIIDLFDPDEKKEVTGEIKREVGRESYEEEYLEKFLNDLGLGMFYTRRE